MLETFASVVLERAKSEAATLVAAIEKRIVVNVCVREREREIRGGRERLVRMGEQVRKCGGERIWSRVVAWLTARQVWSMMIEICCRHLHPAPPFMPFSSFEPCL